MASRIKSGARRFLCNIAEGHGRLNTGEFRQFLGIARASNFELQTQLQIARELEMGDAGQIDQAESLSHEVGKMLYAILETTRKNQAGRKPISDL